LPQKNKLLIAASGTAWCGETLSVIAAASIKAGIARSQVYEYNLTLVGRINMENKR